MKSKRWLIIIVSILVVLVCPLIINWILLKPAIVEVVGDETIWLLFWGGYLSAIISSAIAFVILFIQRRDNRVENENNRKLQLNILIYQQEKQRLDSLRKAMMDNLATYQKNNLVNIFNMALCNENMYSITKQIKELIDRAGNTNDTIEMIMPINNQEKYLSNYNKIREESYNKQIQIIFDYQILVVILRHKVTKCQIDSLVWGWKEIASEKIKKFIFESKENIYESVPDEINLYDKEMGLLFLKMKSATKAFLLKEESRINTILTEDYAS